MSQPVLTEPAGCQLSVHGRPVGEGHPSYVVAEIGINHNGDMGLAREMISAAAQAGADAVKFQNYRTDDFLLSDEATHSYVSRGERLTESQLAMFRRYELDDDQVLELAEYSRGAEVHFHSTPTSAAGVALLKDCGVDVVKNGSDFLTRLDLIEAMGESGLLTVLSTGMATAAEIDDAVRKFRATGNDRLVLLHCVSCYPAAPETLNLRRIETLRRCFGAAVGFSDHSEGTDAAVLSCAFGSCWLEKHFTLSRDLPGPDHDFSSDPTEFEHLVRSLRDAEQSIGDGVFRLTPEEEQARIGFRLSCVARRHLERGHRLTGDDIAYSRPATGIPPRDAFLLEGRVLSRPVRAGEVLDVGDLS